MSRPLGKVPDLLPSSFSVQQRPLRPLWAQPPTPASTKNTPSCNTTPSNNTNNTNNTNLNVPSQTARTTPSSSYPRAPWSNRLTLVGHVGPVLTVCLNEAGSHVLSGGQDRTVRLWNPRNPDTNKNLLATFNDGRITHAIADIAVLPGSKQFVTCGGTTRALLWDLNTKQLTRKFNGHSLRVNCVEHGASGDVLFTGGYDRLIVAHDLRSRTEVQTLPKCKDSVESIAIVGTDIVASDANGCMYTFDVRTGTLRIDNYHTPIGYFKISPDQRCAALSCQDGKVRLVERSSGLLLSTFQGAHVTTDFKIGCTFVNHGSVVVTGSEDGNIVMYDTVTEKIHGVLPKQVVDDVRDSGSSFRAHRRASPDNPEVTAVCTLGTSRDYGFFISGSYDGTISVWYKN